MVATLWELYKIYIYAAFLVNLAAIVAGLIFRSLGYMRVAKVLSYVSLVGVTIPILAILIYFILFMIGWS